MAEPNTESSNIMLLPPGTEVPDEVEVGRFLMDGVVFDTITSEEYNKIKRPEWSLVETEYYGVLLVKLLRLRVPAEPVVPTTISALTNTDIKCTVTRILHRSIGETVHEAFITPTKAVFEPFWHGEVALSCPHSHLIAPPKDTKSTLHILMWSSPQSPSSCRRISCPSPLWGNMPAVRDALTTDTALGGFILRHQGYVIAHLLVSDESCALYIMHDINHVAGISISESTIVVYERILRWAASHLGGPAYNTNQDMKSTLISMYSYQATKRSETNKDALLSETRNYENYSVALISTARRVQELKYERILLEQICNNAEQRCNTVLDELQGLPGVARIYTGEDTDIRIVLDPIEIDHEGSKYIVSDIEICIEGYSGDVWFSGPKICGVVLPNVDTNGRPQSYEFASSACQLIGSCELVTLVQMCINHARSGGPLIVNWPKVG